MKKKAQKVSPNRTEASQILNGLWQTALEDETIQSGDAIKALIASEQVAIRFCLPTQLLGKLTDSALDALCLQRGKDLEDKSRWDPRGFCSAVIVPWNRENQSVLGASGDPYVGNPLRRPRVDHGLEQMGDRAEWENLAAVLTEVQDRGSPEYTKAIFLQVLAAIRDRLRELTFEYVIPERVSLRQVSELVQKFLSERSGGDRGLSVAAALFETIRLRTNLFSSIKRGVINAADAVTESVADLECFDDEDRISLAVEVKERKINSEDVQSSLNKARKFGVRELVFCCEGFVEGDREKISEAFSSAWASGTNLYAVSIPSLIDVMLPILGETSIRVFAVGIGEQLDKFGTQPRHRKAWKTLLDTL